jgi:hypothetical protein
MDECKENVMAEHGDQRATLLCGQAGPVRESIVIPAQVG